MRSARRTSFARLSSTWAPRGPVLRVAGASATSVPQREEVASPESSRSLACCLIGPTNAGKSTLLNALIDSRVSIVSDKIHTTRANTLGYLTDVRYRTQVEFVDAPGALGPTVATLHRAMWDAVRGTELALVVVDAAAGHRALDRPMRRFLGRLARELDEQEAAGGARTQTALVLNKVDRVRPKAQLLETSARLHAMHAFDLPGFMISAKTGDGVNDLRNFLLLRATPGEWAVPAGTTHVQAPLEQVTEIIRGHIFNFCSRELPYALTQRNLGWTELRSGALRIDQQIVVPRRRSAKQIVERRIPGIGAAARVEIAEALGRPVFLSLTTAVVDEDRMDDDPSHIDVL